MSNDSPVQDTVTTAIKERLTSRFGAAAMFAWCGWNYRLLIVAFSDASFEKKLTYISECLYKNENMLWWFAGAPAISAFAYVVVHALGEATSKSFDRIWRVPLSWIVRFFARTEYVPLDELAAFKASVKEEKDRIVKENIALRSRCGLYESTAHAFHSTYENAIERYVPIILDRGDIDKSKVSILYPPPGYTYPKPEKKELFDRHGIPRQWIELLCKHLDSDVLYPNNELLAPMTPLGSFMALDVLAYFGVVHVVSNSSNAIAFRINKGALLPLARDILIFEA